MLKGKVPRLKRSFLLPVILLLAAGFAASCSRVLGGDPEPTPTITPVPATATPEGPDLTVFRNFTFPIEGACLPTGDQLMPNAPREYRSGIHEGVDFYSHDNCVEILQDTPVIAAKDGTIVRLDNDYTPLTQAELDTANARIAAGDSNAFEVVDLFRGRQVWIDHGKGIVTRYAHLNGIAPGLAVGQDVAAGTAIGFVGDSGTPESLSNPGAEIHLHFELRTGEAYLGEGASAEDTRVLYEQLFEPFQ
jgi:murein DD-endopeptidase MepM/ murein hydrolase activator NlpD